VATTERSQEDASAEEAEDAAAMAEHIYEPPMESEVGKHQQV
jgi:hypothetical protein